MKGKDHKPEYVPTDAIPDEELFWTELEKTVEQLARAKLKKLLAVRYSHGICPLVE